MRIAWLTPVTVGTGISRYSAAAVAALRATHDVDIWAEPLVEPGLLEHQYVLSDDAATRRALGQYELVVFNIGNNAIYHDVIFAISRDIQGLLIVHDKVIQDLVFPHYIERGGGVARYLALMTRLYGRGGIRYALRRVCGGATVRDTALFPAVEIALTGCLGVVAHSDEGARLFDRYPGTVPVGRVNIPFFVYPDSVFASIEKPSSRVRVVALGNVVASKRIESVIRALATSSMLRERMSLHVVGGAEPHYASRLQQLVADLGVEQAVEFTGHVDEPTMHSYLMGADVFVNLRHPSTEVASGALVEQIRFGKPVVVSNTGFYGELPDDVVLKVALANEVDETRDALERLVADPALREKMAVAAISYGREHFSAEKYCSDFTAIAERAVAARPVLARARQAALASRSCAVRDWRRCALDAWRRAE